MADHQSEIEAFGSNDDFWLFGYGSLIWKPPPHYEQISAETIYHSEDHRGTPEAPGRVVTLIERAFWATLSDSHTAHPRVWGAAYHIPTQHVAAVRSYLDLREINGYSIQFTPFYAAGGAEETGNSKGPSGENKEYLYNLETALLGLSEDSSDSHISDLVRRCRALEEETGGVDGTWSGMEGEKLHRVGSTEEQEEVEK
ncbi:ChaC protein [Pyrenophora teres f. maculata]|nr:ChaC protein [Pyrenophora teres f. maculata]